MRAVWSFWSRPFGAEGGPWGSRLTHLLAWVLSVETARKHYPRTALVTDGAGARMLVDGLGLEFGTVSTSLDALEGHDPSWWALGKLAAYAEQTEPFVHLDTDVFLWNRLPARLEEAPVFAQNPEVVVAGELPYRPEEVEAAVRAHGDGWVPEEWAWYGGAAERRAACCGIVGGTRVDFLRHYAGQALRLVEHPANRAGLRHLSRKEQHTCALEQYLLGACVEYHRGRRWSPFREVEMEYLFPTWEDALVEENAARAGYTHLMCDAKRDPSVARRLEERVAREHPELYDRCLAYLAGEVRRPRPAAA